MTTVQDMLNAARALSPVEQLEIIQALAHALKQHYAQESPLAEPQHGAQSSPRVMGLDKGAARVSEDFDAELPDDFWLGADNETVT